MSEGIPYRPELEPAGLTELRELREKLSLLASLGEPAEAARGGDRTTAVSFVTPDEKTTVDIEHTLFYYPNPRGENVADEGYDCWILEDIAQEGTQVLSRETQIEILPPSAEMQEDLLAGYGQRTVVVDELDHNMRRSGRLKEGREVHPSLQAMVEAAMLYAEYTKEEHGRVMAILDSLTPGMRRTEA